MGRQAGAVRRTSSGRIPRRVEGADAREGDHRAGTQDPGLALQGKTPDATLSAMVAVENKKLYGLFESIGPPASGHPMPLEPIRAAT